MAQSTNQPGLLNLTIMVGSTWNLILTWTDTNGNPINLSGYSGDMKIRPSVGSSTVLAEMSTAGGGMTLGGVAGTISLTLTASVTALLSWINAVYDLKLTDGSGNVTYLVSGAVQLVPNVT